MLSSLLITFAFRDFFDSLFQLAKKKCKEMLSIVKEKNKLFFFFHLALLILLKSNLVEYIFSYEHIEEIYKIVQDEKKNELLAFIYSKILIELISYFKDTKKYNESNDKEKKVLDNMLSLCDEKIKNSLNNFNIFLFK